MSRMQAKVVLFLYIIFKNINFFLQQRELFIHMILCPKLFVQEVGVALVHVAVIDSISLQERPSVLLAQEVLHVVYF